MMGGDFVVFHQKEAEGRVISSEKKPVAELQEFADFFFETDLHVKEGQNVVKSPIFHIKNPDLSKWQVELDPNAMANDGTRYLSVWVRLVESEKEKVEAMFTMILITTPSDLDYVKESGLFCYSMERPCYGLPKYVEMYRLQSAANPLGDRFRFRLKIRLFRQIPESQMPPPAAVGLTHEQKVFDILRRHLLKPRGG